MAKFALTGMLCACVAAGAVAQTPAPKKPKQLVMAQAIPADFDLAQFKPTARGAPPALRNLDASRFPDKIDPPGVEMELMPDGPVLSAGAFGSKRKCRPKLAHICVDWSF